MTKDIRQSVRFAEFMTSTGWQALKINSSLCYLRKMPFMSNFAKIPRPQQIYSQDDYKLFIRENNIFKLKISPFIQTDDKKFQKKKNQLLSNDFTNDMNPFNPTTMISYKIPVNSQVSLKIYDVLGKEVVTLVNEVKEAGTYSAQFDGAKLSSGVYFYTLQAGKFIETKKLLLTK